MKKVTATGRTVEDAVTSALVRLGISRSQATVRVMSEPVKGLFGFIGGREAQVEVSVIRTPEETARDFLSETLIHMGIDARIRLLPASEDTPTTLEIICDENDLPVVIGKHGSTLDSLQYLVNVVANQGQESYTRLFLDAGMYRQRRQEGLQRLADRAAVRALRTKRPVSLDPMPAHDRKFVHTYLQNRSDVTTTSEGTDPYRKVVVVPFVQTGPARKNG
ncbi:RNA-binding cell elongation regulator Jag/EloR [Alicyclobacillus ferrooxydans]|uniref:RNA-binding protein KhpB n=1 Tax=Alicyclobacillus ferrooxydans TaxID=471514 RepID=A0A0P9CAS3_9BACL|nr:RNA-binding cell elongation regulator Jag/EloR [Alicyclobacillus ferrooxydans]KPV42506.1 single-stranded DNA-binding protein [Alicyclobacillus ferrooxydans]